MGNFSQDRVGVPADELIRFASSEIERTLAELTQYVAGVALDVAGVLQPPDPGRPSPVIPHHLEISPGLRSIPTITPQAEGMRTLTHEEVFAHGDESDTEKYHNGI